MRGPVSTSGLRSWPTPKFAVHESTWPGDKANLTINEDTPIRCCVLYTTDGIGTGSAAGRHQASLNTREV
ncbi:hypothetical protein DAEQUDRAFT_724325 [Daedalea quercina L-15889]|uniref:Uncharacterized protein n=1 Tax=Daedalea quercina L-15889 TaxID=1314783 RepID=A0A165RZZ2_9APHY|nr:hypothetical protein DAEQUDRAFT_724325 [Daedalea quercina L-15889]